MFNNIFIENLKLGQELFINVWRGLLLSKKENQS